MAYVVGPVFVRVGYNQAIGPHTTIVSRQCTFRGFAASEHSADMEGGGTWALQGEAQQGLHLHLLCPLESQAPHHQLASGVCAGQIIHTAAEKPAGDWG